MVILDRVLDIKRLPNRVIVTVNIILITYFQHQNKPPLWEDCDEGISGI